MKSTSSTRKQYPCQEFRNHKIVTKIEIQNTRKRRTMADEFSIDDYCASDTADIAICSINDDLQSTKSGVNSFFLVLSVSSPASCSLVRCCDAVGNRIALVWPFQAAKYLNLCDSAFQFRKSLSLAFPLINCDADILRFGATKPKFSFQPSLVGQIRLFLFQSRDIF